MHDVRLGDEEWLAFLNGLPVAVFALDSQGVPAFANERALLMLGRGIIPAGKDELSTVYPSYIAGTDTPYPPERMPIVRALTEKVRSMVSDVELERKGDRIPIEAWASPILDADGGVRYSIAIFFDTRSRKDAEKERVKRLASESKLAIEQRLGEVQQAFLNHAAHQLYTPLTPLKLQLAVLRDNPTPEGVAKVERYINRLSLAVDQVLQVAKVQGRVAKVEHEPAAASELIAGAIVNVQPFAAERQVTIEQDAGDTELLCDGEAIRDALTGLLHNAIKFSSSGDRIQIAAATNGDLFSISITDVGAGWAMEEAPNFEAFGRGDEDRQNDKGWGLGLYTARSIALAHGGDLRAASPGPGLGARFIFELPHLAS